MKLGDDVEEMIEAELAKPMSCVMSDQLGRARRIDDAAGRYIEFCKSTFGSDLDLVGTKLVVDAAHGAAYHIAAPVFKELGAKVHSIGAQPDGLNINQNVGAMHPELLAQTVIEQGADLGIALDGDADRLQMVDATGRIYNGDEILFAIVRARAALSPVQGVVGTLMTNYAFEKAMKGMNIPFVRAQVGDRYVIEQLKAHQWLFGGEGSGHILCLDCHTTGDGIIAALQVLAALRRHQVSLAEWVADLTLYPQVMINVPIDPKLNWVTHAGLLQAREEVEKEVGDTGRVLIRASGTEPKLRIMVECENAQLAQDSAQRMVDSLSA
jgi:phosphoglucosamine mutase